MGKKKFKLDSIGLIFVVVHSLIVIVLTGLDFTNAIQTGSSGFAVLPIIAIDYPVLHLVSLFDSLFPPISSSLGNTTFILIQKTQFATSFLILGGLQWYCIGWLISSVGRFIPKLKQGLLPTSTTETLERKRFIGIKIFATIFILLGFLYIIPETGGRSILSNMLMISIGFGMLISSFGLFRKKEIARKSLIVLCFLAMLEAFMTTRFSTNTYGRIELILLLNAIVFIPPIIYLTRPKVKEQFK